MITLQKQKNKDFLVLNFTDIHIKDRFWHSDNVRKIIPLHIIDTLVKEVKPDLITVTGDISKSFQYDTYNAVADVLDSYGIPWAVIWGNHDSEGGYEFVDEIEQIFLSHKNFIYESGDHSLGRGNYIIGIEEEGRPVEALIMMDSHSKIDIIDENGEAQNVNAKITPAQIEWYKEQVAALKKMGYKESSLLVHMPIHAYYEAFSAALIKGLNKYEIKYDESFSPVFWNKGYEDSFGVVHQPISACPIDDGMFEVILKEDHTKNILCGHDHKTSVSIPHKGVRFTYSLRSGNSSYDTKQKVGGTMLRINADGVIKVEHLPVKVSHLAELHKKK